MAGDTGNGLGSALAFLGGVALGAVAGVLLAPKSGKETREELSEYAQKTARQLRNTGKAVRDSVAHTSEAIRRSIGNVKEAGEDALARSTDGM